MSTPDTEDGSPRGKSSLLDVLLWVGAPAAAAAIVMAAVVTETATVDGDLQLVAPGSLEPGRRAAVRALLLADDPSGQGPSLTTAPVDLTMRDSSGRPVAATKLRPTPARSMEGILAVPPNLRGDYMLEAVAHMQDGAEPSVRMRVEVLPGARGLYADGRLAFALQHLGLGPLVPEGAAAPPSLLEVRVPSGVCRPEIPCELLVRVGEPLATVSIVQTASVTLGAPDRRDAPPSLARLTVVTHGPEAETELVASRDGVVVARRSLRLPVDLSAAIVRVSRVMLESPARPRVAVEGTEPGRGIIVDGFRDGHWERTVTLAARLGGPDARELPTEPLDPGIWRLQARTDPLGTSSAAGRLLQVRHPGTPVADGLRALARAFARDDPDAEQWARALPPEALRDPDRFAAWLFAGREASVVAQPAAVPGMPQEIASLASRRRALRIAAVIALVLLGAFVGAMLVRRGLAASAQARDVLAAAGDETARSPRTRRLMTATVLAFALALALTFAAAAAFVVLRTGAP